MCPQFVARKSWVLVPAALALTVFCVVTGRRRYIQTSISCVSISISIFDLHNFTWPLSRNEHHKVLPYGLDRETNNNAWSLSLKVYYWLTFALQVIRQHESLHSSYCVALWEYCHQWQRIRNSISKSSWRGRLIRFLVFAFFLCVWVWVWCR